MLPDEERKKIAQTLRHLKGNLHLSNRNNPKQRHIEKKNKRITSEVLSQFTRKSLITQKE